MKGSVRPAGILVTACGGSHRGKVRPNNQDAFLIGDLDRGEVMAASDGPDSGSASTFAEGFDDSLDGAMDSDDVQGRGGADGRGEGRRDAAIEMACIERGPLVIVCDGMGGAAGGEVASQLATETIWSEMRGSQATRDREVYGRLLRRAVRMANARVWHLSHERSELRGMGTTVSALGIAGDVLVIAQVGDSRVYIQRQGELTQVTRDQSVVSALVREGRIEPEKARNAPHANVVLQALGVRDDVEVAISVVDLRRGDRVLVSSDGLHGLIDRRALSGVLSLRDHPAGATELLIDAANAAGGPDNITVVVVDFAGETLEDSAGDDDRVHFVELDPAEVGDAAISTTSRVARRLAARAGIGSDPAPPVVPATIQHAVVLADDPGPRDADHDRDFEGPASRAFADASRFSSRTQLTLVAVTLAVVGLIIAIALIGAL